MQEQQTEIPEALLGAMMLGQAAQSGQFQPTTPDGMPTVAAKLMQQAAPSMGAPMMGQPMAGLGQIAKQAGLGAQIQAMQMQEAQKAMMNQAMQQQQAPGIVGLNPQMGNFAGGGIVGYNGFEESFVEEPAQAGAAAIEMGEETPEAQFGLGLEALRRSQGREVKAEDALKKLKDAEEIRRQFLQGEGIDPNYMAAEAQRIQSRGDEQAKYYADLAAAKRAQQQEDARMQFFLGARGARFGEAMRTGAEAAIRGEKATEAAVERINELRFDIQNSAAKERRLLDKARFDIANGRFDAAQRELQEAEKLRQQRELKEADFRRQMGMEYGRSERAAETEETRRRGQDMRLQGIRDRLERAQSTGTAKGARVQRTITGPDGGVVLIMSDGTQVATGITSGEFNRTVARLITDMARRDPAFAELPEAEKRTKALERLTGSPTGAAPAPAPVAAPGGVARPTTQAQFDALSKGARYINPSDGKEYVKN
jgi:hypothetical protein